MTFTKAVLAMFLITVVERLRGNRVSWDVIRTRKPRKRKQVRRKEICPQKANHRLAVPISEATEPLPISEPVPVSEPLECLGPLPASVYSAVPMPRPMPPPPPPREPRLPQPLPAWLDSVRDLEGGVQFNGMEAVRLERRG
jgi:hypothetical protein